MIIISDILSFYFKNRLKNKEYRVDSYKKALNHQLRVGKLNTVLLRELNKLMSSNTTFHDEFKALIGKKDFQEAFWESDLGFLWYSGNLNSSNIYFDYTLNKIKENKLESLLDIGCGWGEFPYKACSINSIKKVKAIDISENVISIAKKKHSHPLINFECMDIMKEKEKYELLTMFGSIDYVLPENIFEVINQLFVLAKKQIIIVNSLRNIPFDEVQNLSSSVEIKRYDVGYVHPFNYYLNQLIGKYKFKYSIVKAGADSQLISIEIL